MNVRTLRLSTLGACLLALGAVALKPTGDSGYAPPPAPSGNGGIIQSCGPDNYTYCYGESWDSAITYQSVNSFPIALVFNGGNMESCCDYMQIYDGLDNFAPLIGQYTGPMAGVFAASTNPDHALFVVWHSDGSVSCQSGAESMLDWTVSCLDCTAPTATFDVTLDCAQGGYFVNVNITQMGTDPAIDITNTGGAAVVTATSPGTYTVGPFTPASDVQVTLENDLNPLCNVNSGTLTSLPCPIISCGPNTYDYCYSNSDTYIQIYQGTSAYPLRLQFNSGSIYQWDGDLLTIYDGLNDQAPVLYSGTGVNGDLTGVYVTSTNADHALTLKMVSTQFTSCNDGGAQFPWNYTVGCLDCDPPAGTAGLVNTDCAQQSYTVQVTVTDLGTDPEIEIGNNVGAPGTMVTAPGTYTAGPFQIGLPVELTLVNDANALCNVPLGSFENTFCPVINVTCGNPAIEQSHCYANGVTDTWLYQNVGPESLAMLFSSLYIEGWFYSNVRVYDGVDNSAPLLWSTDMNADPNFQFTNNDYAGQLVISTGPSIYMEAVSTGFSSCANGAFGFSPWEWTVGCLDCTQPDATFSMDLNCADSTFTVSTHITAIGSDPTLQLSNTLNSDIVQITDTGLYTAGPFTYGTDIQFTLAADVNTLCNRVSPHFTNNPPCAQISCASATYEDCYGNGWDTTVVYQSDSQYPIALRWNAGNLESCCDRVEIRDGNYSGAPQIYYGNNGGQDMGQVDPAVSSNPDNALWVRFTSDGSVNCSDGTWGFIPVNWTVACLDCTSPSVTFEQIPDCIHNGFVVEVNVTELGTNVPSLIIRNTLNGDTITNVHTGTYTAGPFPVDSTVNVIVESVNNALCRQVSPDYTYPSSSCVNVACTPTGEEYCYTNADTAWFIYTSGTTDPVTIHFEYGQLLVNDYIQIFNGLDTSAQIVYMGNQGGQLGGLAISSSNPDNALTLLVISSQQGSCATGQGFPPLYWSVGCGLVGENEFTVDKFAMFPNPTNADLYVRLGDGITGKIRMDVMDITGRLAMSEQFTATTGQTERFDLGALVNGTYAVRLSTDSWSKTEMLQVAR